MRKSLQDPERQKRIRTAAGVMLALAGLIVLAAIGFTYGPNGGALNSGLFGLFLALLAVAVLRNPFGASSLVLLTGLIGLWLAASPFVLGYYRYVITMGVNLWVGLLTVLLSAFIYGEALRLHQPLDALD